MRVGGCICSWCEGCRVVWTVLLMVLSVGLAGTASAEQCKTAQSKCMAQLGCGMALHNYLMSCGELIHGQTNRCSSACKKAIISLLSTQDQEGENLMTCDCQGNQFCRLQKDRLEVCSNDVMTAMATINDPRATINCSLADLICSADTTCLTALDYYKRHCGKLFSGTKCTARCNNSLTILYRQVKARKLRTCQCDGQEQYDCNTVRHNTQTLCFGRSNPHRHHQHRSRKSTEAPAASHPTPNHLFPASHACPPSHTSGSLLHSITLLLTLLMLTDMLPSR